MCGSSNALISELQRGELKAGLFVADYRILGGPYAINVYFSNTPESSNPTSLSGQRREDPIFPSKNKDFWGGLNFYLFCRNEIADFIQFLVVAVG